MTYEPTPEQIEAAYQAYISDDGDIRSSFRAALIAAEKAAWVKIGDAPKPERNEDNRTRYLVVSPLGYVEVATLDVSDWDDDEKACEWKWNGRHEYHDADLDCTHFRPMPPPPEQDQ